MKRFHTIQTVIVLLLGPATLHAAPAPDPVTVRGESAQTRKRLAEAEQKLIGGKTAEAIDDIQRVLDDDADDLISVDGKELRPARFYAHQVLAKLPPEALKAYRDRIELSAVKLLEAGKKGHDLRPLWQLLDRYYVSRPAEEGIVLLGDLVFERGEFRTAELLWRHLLPDADADLPYPLPKSDPAEIRARAILAAIFQGDIDRAKRELSDFRSRYPTAAGKFAGKDGPYAATLEGFLGRSPLSRTQSVSDPCWSTFAGDPQRSGRVNGPMPYRWPSRPTWTETITTDPANLTAGPTRVPFGHPVICGDRVYVSDGNRVFGFDLLTGRPTPPSIQPGNFEPEPRFSRKKGDGVSSASMSIDGGRLYGRLGPAVVRGMVWLEPRAARFTGDSTLACFGPSTLRTGGEVKLAESWRLKPPPADSKPTAIWEGAPLVVSGRMWAALARFEGGRVAHSVVCYDPADSTALPDRPLWVVELCDSPLTAGSETRVKQELLTLAGRNLVFCSNSGVVAAIDAASGRRSWAFRYPRSTRRGTDGYVSADPAPCVSTDGRVFVAPTDSDRIFALDAESGRLLWEFSPVDRAQILGIAQNRLIVTVAGPVRGIFGLAVATGSYRGPTGWVQASGGGVLNAGRGLVSDDVILWPTREATQDWLHFLNPLNGMPLCDPIPGSFGNLAYAAGVLTVVTPTQITGFVSDSRLPGSEGPIPRPQSDPGRRQFDILIDRAEQLLAKGDTDAARRILLEVVKGEFPNRFRAWAAARLILVSPLDTPLVPDLAKVLSPGLLREWVFTPDGNLLTVGMLLARHEGKERRENSVEPAAQLTLREAKSADAPRLGRTARIEHILQLPANAIPLRSIAGGTGPPRSISVSAGAELLNVSLEHREATIHAAPNCFTHASDLHDGFVAAGPQTVAIYGTSREPAWVFRVPDTDVLPDGIGRISFRTDAPVATPALSSFLLAGSWFIARLGEEHLIGINLHERRVAWVLGTHGRSRFEPFRHHSCLKFEANFAAFGSRLLIQLSDGQRWVIQIETGHICGGNSLLGSKGQTAKVPWTAPPAELEDGRAAVSDGLGIVRLLDLATGSTRWKYIAEGENSLAGSPPRTRAWGDRVLVAIRRNHGVELDCLDPSDGRSTWSTGPVFFDADCVNLSGTDLDPLRAFVPAGDKFIALSLADGKTLWEVELPTTNGAGGWVVRAGRKVVIVYPERAIPTEPIEEVWERAARSFLRRPQSRRLPGLAETLYDSWYARTVPVLLFDPKSGKRLAQLDIPARGPAVTAWFDRDLAVVATGDRVAWLR